MTGDDFVGLARLNFFVSRWACAIFVSELRASGVSWWAFDSCRSFLFERHERKILC